jgi:hypothetical protein
MFSLNRWGYGCGGIVFPQFSPTNGCGGIDAAPHKSGLLAKVG